MSYQIRMKEELTALNSRCDRLLTFLDSDTYEGLPDADQVLLLAQSVHMVGYATFLKERVGRLYD